MGSRIFFEAVPASLRRPGMYGEFNTKLAISGLSAQLQRLIILAPRLASGTQPAANPVSVFNTDQVAQLAGYGSIAHDMSIDLLGTNRYVSLDLVLVDDPTGTSAFGSVVYAGTITNGGTESVYLNDERIDIVTTATSTAATLSSDFATEINKRNWLTVTADGTTVPGTLKLTHKHKGTIGNATSLSVTGNTTGLTRTVNAFASGAGSHDISAALTSIFPAGHNLIASAFSDNSNLVKLRTHCGNVSGPMEGRGCRAWYGMTDTLANATSNASGINDWLVHQAYIRYTKSAPWAVAAAVAAQDIAEEDPARPLNSLTLPTLFPPAIADRFSFTELQNLLWNGVTPLEVGPGERVQIVRAVTTCTTNALGAPDPARLDITTPKTLFWFRNAVLNDQKIRFSREKITDRVLKAVRQRALEIAYMAQDLEILRDVDKYKDDFETQIDAQDVTRVNLRCPVPIVPGLHILATRFDLYLSGR